jgi:hypothetical protein
MFTCKLCGLTIDAIPEDAVLIGKLYRFMDGSFHFLRKVLAPRTGLRPRKRHPDQEAPEPTPSTPVPRGVHAYEMPPLEKTPEQPILEPERATEDDAPVGETPMSRAFRLAKVHNNNKPVDWNYGEQNA